MDHHVLDKIKTELPDIIKSGPEVCTTSEEFLSWFENGTVAELILVLSLKNG